MHVTQNMLIMKLRHVQHVRFTQKNGLNEMVWPRQWVLTMSGKYIQFDKHNEIKTNRFWLNSNTRRCILYVCAKIDRYCMQKGHHIDLDDLQNSGPKLFLVHKFRALLIFLQNHHFLDCLRLLVMTLSFLGYSTRVNSWSNYFKWQKLIKFLLSK